jgi:hypothetical protein
MVAFVHRILLTPVKKLLCPASQEPAFSHYSEDGCMRFFQNIIEFLPDYVTSHPKKPYNLH